MDCRDQNPVPLASLANPRWKLKLEESVRIELTDPLLDRGLASRCLHHSANSPGVWRLMGESNPRYRHERPVSLATRRMRRDVWCEGLGSNQRRAAFQAAALPSELPTQENEMRAEVRCAASRLVPRAGLEPARVAAPPPQDGVSTNSTTWASNSGCEGRI